jgi:hypothetical protein
MGFAFGDAFFAAATLVAGFFAADFAFFATAFLTAGADAAVAVLAFLAAASPFPTACPQQISSSMDVQPHSSSTVIISPHSSQLNLSPVFTFAMSASFLVMMKYFG